MTLYFTIIIYILSVIIGLFLMATVKRISTKRLLALVSVHPLLLLFFFLTKTTASSADAEHSNNLFFLFFICSGILIAGLAWRSTVHISLKVYFSLFAFTIALFIFSPSRLMVFLLSGRYTDTFGKTFPVSDHYFLEQQTSSSGNPTYKIILKHGIFHETIQRNIVFKGKLDSIRVLEFVPNEKTVIRGYSGKETYVSSQVDSLDVEVNLEKKKPNGLERKL